jgi:hypothetical protein
MIEQAIYGSHDTGGYRFLARSPGFREDWQSEAELLCTRFGERPAGIACPAAVFARPFAQDQVAIVQVADQGSDDAGRPGALAFRLLILPASLYADLGGDPFHLAEQFPPSWQARQLLDSLDLPGTRAPARAVEGIQKILNVPNSPTLLGGVQALVEGKRLVFERTSPDLPMVRSLWELLPQEARCSLWPASFAFSNKHRFDVLVAPHAEGPDYVGYLSETQAGDYPEGCYELSLQAAVEAGDQAALDSLLAGRKKKRTVPLIAALLAVLILSPLGLAVLSHFFPPAEQPDRQPASGSTADEPLSLPPVEECPALTGPQRSRLARALQELGTRLAIPLPEGSSTKDLENTLAAFDARLGTPDPRRDPGPLRQYGPLQRQLRALLWKHGAAGYTSPGLSPEEMVEKLQKKWISPPRKE